MKDYKIGFRVNCSWWMAVIAIDWDYFSWSPGLVESGSSSPGQRFDCYHEKDWLFSFLCFTLFFARAY